MPFCAISADVSLHYVTSSQKGDATDLDLTKPTILLLPPMLTAVPWLREQFKDARLSGRYNLIAFDPRNVGQTRAPFCPKRDAWVDAADLAVAHEKLQLPSCHVFASVMPSCVAALSFAALFPAKCLSLVLCSMPTQPGDDPEWVLQGYSDLLDAWCFPSDLDTYEQACMELSWFLFNGQATAQLEDEMIAWWQTNLPPTNRTGFLAQSLSGLNRPRFSNKELRAIEIPTLFVQGEKNPSNPPERAQEVSDKIPNSKLFVVQGGPAYMTLIPEYASIVNRIYCQFLDSLPPVQVVRPSQPDPEGLCQRALERLADFADDPSIAQRDPTSNLSFSRLTPEMIKTNMNYYENFAKGERVALNPLDEHGYPIRKFSERHKNQWEPAAFEHMKGRIVDGAVGVVTVVESSSVSIPSEQGV